ncbi:hypothetical protein C7293_05205 [filamentous cyanobacterium CCT1]|nr:hypothetical protein C7293_05205 [filamentous cyanobacterium CCT1]PSN79175.1 hypothetical protein C8B47_13075 [filamentous cyanobacterium CCP4]
MDRVQLFDALRNLPPQDFERLLFALKPPGGLIAGPEAPQINRVKALLDWAESSSGRGLEEVQGCFNKLQNGTLPAAFDFSRYLKAVCEDDRYRKGRVLYTETEVLIPLEAETVEKKSRRADSNREDESQQQKVERFPVLEGLRKYALGDKRQHLLLAGRPGSGKSTTLKRLLLETAEAALEQPEVIPVYVQLKGDRPIIDLIITEFRRAKVRVTSEQINEWLFNDLLLLLLDGVNEVPSNEQRLKLQEFREDNPTAPMIFTTRDLAAGGDLGIEKRLEMRPLSETQMREFVQNYLPNHAETLLRQLKDRLREVAETPLLLKMLCDVFDHATKQIPQSKGELFRLFDSKYDKFKGLVAGSDDFRRFKPELLQHLAFSMLQGDPAKPTEPWLTLDRNRAERLLETYLTGRVEAPGQRAKEWLEDLLEHHLLQSASDPKEIEFHHQLFQEYYAAEALLIKLPELLQDEDQFKRDYLNLLKWTEAIAMMLALVNGDNQALRIVKLAIDDVDWILGANLAGNLQPNSQRKIINEITRFSPASENLKVALLGYTRSNFAIPHLLPYLGSNDFDLQYTLNRALEQINSEDLVAVLTETISDKNPTTRIASIAALTNIPSQEAMQALRKALRHESPETRWSAAEALGDIGSLEAEEDLVSALSDPSLNVVRQAASALGKLASEKSVRLILQKLQESSSIDGIYFSHALASIGSDKAVTALIKLYLEDDRLDFSMSAIEQTKIPQEAISIILEALSLDYTSVQINAILAVGDLGLKLAVPHLIVLAHSDVYQIQGAAIEALGKLKAFEAKDLLIEKLEGKDYCTVTKAAIAVGRLNIKETIPKLKALLYDKRNNVREDILYALSLMNDIEAWNGILDLLEDDNINARRIAISTLKSSNLEEVANDSRLFLVLRSENNELALADALEILGASKSNSKFSVLESFLEHPDSVVRRGAINGLRISSSKKSVNLLREKVLCKLIDDSVVLGDDLIFVEAAHAIGEIGDPEDLPFLVQLLKKTGKEYFLEAILNIQSRCKFYNYEVSQQGGSALNQGDKAIANTITIQTVEKLTIMSDKAPIFNQQQATIGVNYAAEDSQQDFTQHIHAPEQNFEILLTGYKHFIDELQQQHPHVTDETAIIHTIDIEARRIDTRWQNFLNLRRLWNGGKKAAIKVGEHFVESNPWGKGAIAFLEGVSEDVK